MHWLTWSWWDWAVWGWHHPWTFAITPAAILALWALSKIKKER